MKAFLTIIASILLSLLAVHLVPAPSSSTAAAAKNDVYDRVMANKTIRCGYSLWPPAMLTKDPTTGKLGGIFYEITEAMAKNMDLKVEWTEEVAWGPNIEAGLDANRYDLFCAPLWINGPGSPHFNYSVPLMYSASHLYVRANDHRFDKNIWLLNDAKYKLAAMDGEQSSIIAGRFFPKAQVVATPQLSELTQLLLNVGTGKADGTFLEPSLAKAYSEENPGKIRKATDMPFQVFPNVYGSKLGEERFSRMVDSSLTELLNSGEVDRITVKFEPDRGIFMPVALPYIPVQPQALK